MSRGRSLLAAVLLAGGLAPGCGDALSSLDAVREADCERYPMQLVPDFARRGQSVAFTITLDAELAERLAGQPAYPSQIQFGAGAALRAFHSDGAGTLAAEVLISPLAEEGERQALLVFACGDGRAEAQGRYWVLPALPAAGDN